jgi:hypothetical protein
VSGERRFVFDFFFFLLFFVQQAIVRDMRTAELENGDMRVSRITLNTLLSGLARAVGAATPGEERKQVIDEAETVWKEIVDTWGEDDRTRTIHLSVYTTGHMMVRAQNCFAEFGESPPLFAHTLMLKMYSQMGRPQLLQDAWTRLSAQEDIVPDSVVYKWVIQGLARAYWIKSAVEVVRCMTKQGLVPDQRHLRLLRQRCGEEDLRKQRFELEGLVKEASEKFEKSHKKKENQSALMRQKLEGDGVRPFLLPFPLLHLKKNLD